MRQIVVAKKTFQITWSGSVFDFLFEITTIQTVLETVGYLQPNLLSLFPLNFEKQTDSLEGDAVHQPVIKKVPPCSTPSFGDGIRLTHLYS